MRLFTPDRVTLAGIDEHKLRFVGHRGEVFEIIILEHDLVRVRHLPDGTARLNRTWSIVAGEDDVPLSGRLRDDLTGFSTPAFRTEQHGDILHIHTDELSLRVDCASFHIQWLTKAGEVFASDLKKRAYTYDRAGRSVYHYMERRLHERYYGLGESSGKLDKHGQQIRMRNMDALGYDAETSTPLYKHIPFYITYEPSLDVFYGLFYDNGASCNFDMGREVDAFWGFYRTYQADDGDVDYYLLYGASMPEVIEKYAWLVGKPTLTPRWSLGYLGSTMSYTEAPNAQEQLRQFIRLCQQHDIPCDLFHLSSGYTTDSRGVRYVFTWNRDKIPQPEQMVDDFHQAGIHLVANIKPYLLTSHPDYEDVAEAGAFIQNAEDDTPVSSTFWSGGAFESGEGGYIDFTNTAGFAWWQGRIKETLLAYGIDAIWNDNNEFEIWDDEARCHGFGQTIPIGQARPLQTLLMGRASYEALRDYHPDLRPFVLTRAGSAGIQRYAQTWSGDNATSWHTLRYNIPMGLSLSVSGVPNMGHDVGGFFGDAPSPELFVRWAQNGIFHPRFTIHSWNTDGTVNEPWMYPEVLDIMRQTIHFRYRLIPYLYSLLYHASQTGQPIIRPLVYDFPHDEPCQTASFEFMLGSELLIATVLEPDARTRDVYLPSGVGWYDFHTGDHHHGGQTVTLDAPLERPTFLVIEGGLLPMTQDPASESRQVYVFPHQAEGERTFTLVEDDGVSMAYKEGQVSFVDLTVSTTADDITLKARARGQYELGYDAIAFILPAGEKRPVRGEIVSQTVDDDGRPHYTIRLA